MVLEPDVVGLFSSNWFLIRRIQSTFGREISRLDVLEAIVSLERERSSYLKPVRKRSFISPMLKIQQAEHERGAKDQHPLAFVVDL